MAGCALACAASAHRGAAAARGGAVVLLVHPSRAVRAVSSERPMLPFGMIQIFIPNGSGLLCRAGCLAVRMTTRHGSNMTTRITQDNHPVAPNGPELGRCAASRRSTRSERDRALLTFALQHHRARPSARPGEIVAALVDIDIRLRQLCRCTRGKDPARWRRAESDKRPISPFSIRG
jgi:hypothetical protein